MQGNMRLCVGCMSRVAADADHCPKCGYNGTQQNESYALPIGTHLGERYVVGMVTDCDGTTITYAGYDRKSGRVTIKEYMPVSAASREGTAIVAAQSTEIHYKTGLSDFSELFGKLAELSNQAGLLSVREVFSMNNTAYVVEEFFGGITLAEYLELRKEPISAAQCLSLMKPVFDGASAIHRANLLHCGISPQTIMLKSDGTVKLTGYAMSSVRVKGTEYPARLFDGYSAPEQYSSNNFLSPAADIYALAACVYKILSREELPSAQQRKLVDGSRALSEIMPDCEPHVSRALSNALVVDPKSRTESASILYDGLCGAIAEPVEAPPAAPLDPAEVRYAKTLKIWKIIAACMGSAVLVFAMIFFAWQYLMLDDEVYIPPEEGPKTIVVENYVGKNIFADKLTFDTAITCELRFSYNSGYSENVIYASSPAEGGTVKEGGKLVLYVSLGVKSITMPKLVGLSAANAQRVLEELGYTDIPNYVYTQSDNFTNCVTSQSIKEGTVFEVGSQELYLTISTSKETYVSDYVPDWYQPETEGGETE